VKLNDLVIEIRERADLRDIAEVLGIEGARGTRKTVLCPFHEDRNPSLGFFEPASGAPWRYHCFACGKRGDVFDFVSEKQGLDFLGAVEWLRAHLGLTKVDRGRRPTSPAPMEGLEAALEIFDTESEQERGRLESFAAERGFSTTTLREAGLRVAADQKLRKTLDKSRADEARWRLIEAAGLLKRTEAPGARGAEHWLPIWFGATDLFTGDRVVVPIYNGGSGRRLAGLAARALSADDKPKYLYNRGFKKAEVLYGLETVEAALRAGGRTGALFELYVVEGLFDALRLRSHGFQAVALLGAELSPAQRKLLLDLGKLAERLGRTLAVHLCLDFDDAGRVGTERAAQNLLGGPVGRERLDTVDFRFDVIDPAAVRSGALVEPADSGSPNLSKDPDELLRGLTADEARIALAGARVASVEWLLWRAAGVDRRLTDAVWRGLGADERSIALKRVVRPALELSWSRILGPLLQGFEVVGAPLPQDEQGPVADEPVWRGDLASAAGLRAQASAPRRTAWAPPTTGPGDDERMMRAIILARASTQRREFPVDEGAFERIERGYRLFGRVLRAHVQTEGPRIQPIYPYLGVRIPKLKPTSDGQSAYRTKAGPAAEDLVVGQLVLNALLRSDTDGTGFDRQIPAVRVASVGGRREVTTTGPEGWLPIGRNGKPSGVEEDVVSYAYQIRQDVVDGRARHGREGIFRPFTECWAGYLDSFWRFARRPEVRESARSARWYRARLDVAKYYDRIPRAILLDRLRGIVAKAVDAFVPPLEPATMLLPDFVSTGNPLPRGDLIERVVGIVDGYTFGYGERIVGLEPDYLAELRQQVTVDRGIPQGPDLSAWLGTIYLMQLDRKMSEAAYQLTQRGIPTRYARYVDDIILVSTSTEAVRDLTYQFERGLEDLRLELNDKNEPLDPVSTEGLDLWLRDSRGRFAGSGPIPDLEALDATIPDVVLAGDEPVLDRSEGLAVLHSAALRFGQVGAERALPLVKGALSPDDMRYGDLVVAYSDALLAHYVGQSTSGLIDVLRDLETTPSAAVTYTTPTDRFGALCEAFERLLSRRPADNPQLSDREKVRVLEAQRRVQETVIGGGLEALCHDFRVQKVPLATALRMAALHRMARLDAEHVGAESRPADPLRLAAADQNDWVRRMRLSLFDIGALTDGPLTDDETRTIAPEARGTHDETGAWLLLLHGVIARSAAGDVTLQAVNSGLDARLKNETANRAGTVVRAALRLFLPTESTEVADKGQLPALEVLEAIPLAALTKFLNQRPQPAVLNALVGHSDTTKLLPVLPGTRWVIARIGQRVRAWYLSHGKPDRYPTLWRDGAQPIAFSVPSRVDELSDPCWLEADIPRDFTPTDEEGRSTGRTERDLKTDAALLELIAETVTCPYPDGGDTTGVLRPTQTSWRHFLVHRSNDGHAITQLASIEVPLEDVTLSTALSVTSGQGTREVDLPAGERDLWRNGVVMADAIGSSEFHRRNRKSRQVTPPAPRGDDATDDDALRWALFRLTGGLASWLPESERTRERLIAQRARTIARLRWIGEAHKGNRLTRLRTVQALSRVWHALLAEDVSISDQDGPGVAAAVLTQIARAVAATRWATDGGRAAETRVGRTWARTVEYWVALSELLSVVDLPSSGGTSDEEGLLVGAFAPAARVAAVGAALRELLMARLAHSNREARAGFGLWGRGDAKPPPAAEREAVFRSDGPGDLKPMAGADFVRYLDEVSVNPGKAGAQLLSVTPLGWATVLFDRLRLLPETLGIARDPGLREDDGDVHLAIQAEFASFATELVAALSSGARGATASRDGDAAPGGRLAAIAARATGFDAAWLHTTLDRLHDLAQRLQVTWDRRADATLHWQRWPQRPKALEYRDVRHDSLVQLEPWQIHVIGRETTVERVARPDGDHANLWTETRCEGRVVGLSLLLSDAARTIGAEPDQASQARRDARPAPQPEPPVTQAEISTGRIHEPPTPAEPLERAAVPESPEPPERAAPPGLAEPPAPAQFPEPPGPSEAAGSSAGDPERGHGTAPPPPRPPAREALDATSGAVTTNTKLQPSAARATPATRKEPDSMPVLTLSQANVESSKMGGTAILPDAVAFAIEDLTGEQDRAKRRIDELLRLYAQAARDAHSKAKALERDDSGETWVRGLTEIPRNNIQTILIDGSRGSGKTSLLRSLRESWLRDRSTLESDSKSAGLRIVPLPTVELEYLPQDRPLAVTLLHTLLPLIDALEPPPDRASPIDPRNDRPDFARRRHPTLRECLEKASRALTLAWASDTGRGGASRDLGEWNLDAMERALAWQGAHREIRSLFDELASAFHASERKRPLIVLPLDDVDLRGSGALDVVRALRLVQHPNLVVILSADMEHFRRMLERDLRGDRADPAPGYVALAQAYLEKHLPQASTVRLANLTFDSMVDLLRNRESAEQAADAPIPAGDAGSQPGRRVTPFRLGGVGRGDPRFASRRNALSRSLNDHFSRLDEFRLANVEIVTLRELIGFLLTEPSLAGGNGVGAETDRTRAFAAFLAGIAAGRQGRLGPQLSPDRHRSFGDLRVASALKVASEAGERDEFTYRQAWCALVALAVDDDAPVHVANPVDVPIIWADNPRAQGGTTRIPWPQTDRAKPWRELLRVATWAANLQGIWDDSAEKALIDLWAELQLGAATGGGHERILAEFRASPDARLALLAFPEYGLSVAARERLAGALKVDADGDVERLAALHRAREVAWRKHAGPQADMPPCPDDLRLPGSGLSVYSSEAVLHELGGVAHGLPALPAESLRGLWMASPEVLPDGEAWVLHKLAAAGRAGSALALLETEIRKTRLALSSRAAADVLVSGWHALCGDTPDSREWFEVDRRDNVTVHYRGPNDLTLRLVPGDPSLVLDQTGVRVFTFDDWAVETEANGQAAGALIGENPEQQLRSAWWMLIQAYSQGTSAPFGAVGEATLVSKSTVAAPTPVLTLPRIRSWATAEFLRRQWPGVISGLRARYEVRRDDNDIVTRAAAAVVACLAAWSGAPSAHWPRMSLRNDLVVTAGSFEFKPVLESGPFAEPLLDWARRQAFAEYLPDDCRKAWEENLAGK